MARYKRKKSRYQKGAVRTSQLVTTYGVGALVASGDESFIIAGIEDWFPPGQEHSTIGEPRLERLLRVRELRRPPASGDDHDDDVPVRRFPRQQICPSCRRVDDISRFGGRLDEAMCGDCEHSLVPSRFVVACDHGHLDDFPYFRWVHKNSNHPQGRKPEIYLETRGRSSGLHDILITCSCGANRTMDGAFDSQAMAGVKRCGGTRPWLDRDSSEGHCVRPLKVLQRGASNIWFRQSVSALAIPPWSDAAYQRLDKAWRQLRKARDLRRLRENIEDWELADEHHSVDDLVAAAEVRLAMERDASEELLVESIKADEYRALHSGASERDHDDHFVCIDVSEPGAVSRQYFSAVRRVDKLRLVHVLVGFSRVTPAAGSPEAAEEGDDEGGEGPKVVRLPGIEQGWYPAIDVIGEGVFLDLDGPRLREWEIRPDVQYRAQELRREASPQSNVPDQLPTTPRALLVHTFSHALITQWALESGYSESELAERLYVDDDRAGLLIYTASSDSAGSLGGLVARLDQERLDDSLREAILRAGWCSADPLCIEAVPGGTDARNLAACHACVLLPETSCEHQNQLLDRVLLVGTDDQPQLGFFADLLRETNV